MSSTTDVFNFNTTEMFAKIREGLPATLTDSTQNLLECKDDLLYVWNEKEKCLLVTNWRAAQLNIAVEFEYQTLTPAVPQHFKVDRIVVSHENSLIALAGLHGITVLKVPHRLSRTGLFKEGKDTRQSIICRATNLDTTFFANNSHLEMRQLRWHPASPNDSHLLALFSDNTLRVYDDSVLRHVWRLGPIPRSLNSSAQCLGEVVVDFDIAPAMKTFDGSVLINEMNELSLNCTENQSKNANTDIQRSPKSKKERVEFPIIVLRENGNVYVLVAGLDTEYPRLQGPLTFTPESHDNYGVNSCAILVMPSLPITLVIAESTGKLHHALLLETKYAEESFNESDASLDIYPSEWSVHVLETIELELGLPEPNSPAYICPIHMKRDYINELRYFAYHNAGLHVITINFINETKRYLQSSVKSDVNGLSTPSRAEYLLCTRINSGEHPNAVLGFALLQMPSAIVLLLASGQIISLKTVIDAQFLTESYLDNRKGIAVDTGYEAHTLKSDVDKKLEQILDSNFGDQIKSILKRDVTQPILSVDKTNVVALKECQQLLTQATEVLRTQYLARQDEARTAIVNKVSNIRLQIDQQRSDIEFLEKSRKEISEIAHRQAERFEDLKENMESLTKKGMDIVRMAYISLPDSTNAEIEYTKQAKQAKEITRKLVHQLNNIRETINRHQYHINKYNETHTEDKKFVLPAKEERVIKEILAEATIEIQRELKQMRTMLDACA